MADLDINNVDPIETPAPQPSLDELWQNTLNEHSGRIKESNQGKSTPFAGKDVERYLSYGSETFGKLGYDPHVDNSKLYNANTHWSADIFRAMDGYSKLAGIGRRDTFAFGAFSEKDSHKSFKDAMDVHGSTREGATGFVSNTLLSAGYTVGIIQAIAAEEAILLATTGGLGNIGTAGEVGRGVSNIWKAWDKGSKTRNVVASSIRFGRKIENARYLKSPVAFAKQLSPIGESARFIKNFSKIKGLNQWQKGLQGAASLARDARKIHMSMAESNLEASLARDETRDRLYDEWFSGHPGEELSNAARLDIETKSDDVFKIAYGANVGLIYVTNAITFGTMFKSMSLTNRAFGMMQSGRLTMKSIGKDVTFKAVKQGLSSYGKNKIANVTWKGTLLGATRASMEGVQEIGQDFISGYAKRFVAGNERLRGQAYESMLGAMGDMKAESFWSGFLMGTFAAPTSISIKHAQDFVLHGGHESVTNRAKWKEKRQSDYKSRVKDAEFLTEFFNTTGSWLDVQGDASFKVTEAQEKMVKAGEEGDRMGYEDARSEIFRIGMKKVMKNGLEKEMIGHLEGLKEHTVDELNESLDRKDITDDNIGEFKDKIDAKIKSVKEYKKNFDEAQDEVNPIDINKLDETDPDFNAKRFAYFAFEDYRDQLMFTKDGVRDLAVRLDGMSKIITKDGVINNSELQTMLDSESLSREVMTLTADVQANKEYDVAPADLKYKEEKLNSLKAYQKALVKFENLKEGSSAKEIDLVHDEMALAFSGIVNANLKVGDDASQRVLNTEKFGVFWDYLIKSTERKSLQKYANMMLNPNIATDYMEKAKGVLEDMEKKKGDYILKSLNALLEYDVGNEMYEDLSKAGYIFAEEELDDLIKNQIMPSKLYNIKTGKNLTDNEAKKAQAIIDRHVKRLKNKHVFATATGYTTRKKNPSDKRQSKWFYRTFGKKDTPIKISSFIGDLLKSPHITESEKEILNVLKDLDVANGEVILTESADAPVSIEKDGTIKIDVRFSSEDFRNSKTPFEYIATSALLQAHYAKQLKSDPALKEATISLMKRAREAYIVKKDSETSANIKIFTDPVHFLSESLNNKAFQVFLSSVEDVEDVEDIKAKSLWESFTEMLKNTFGKFFEASLLNRAVKLSQLALTDEALELTLEAEEEVEEVEEELTEEKKERSEELGIEIKKVEAKIKEVKGVGGLAGVFSRKSRKIESLNVELRHLKDELKDLQKKKVVKKKKAVIKTDLKEKLDSEGNVIIGRLTPFHSLPKDAMEEIASFYLIAKAGKVVQEKGTPESEPLPDAMQASQGKFDETTEETEENPVPESALSKLVDADIVEIQEEMLTNILYHEILLKHHKKRLHSQEAVEEVVEEVVIDTKKIEPLVGKTKTKVDLEVLIPGSTSLFNESEVRAIVSRMNDMSTIESLAGYLKSVQQTVNDRSAEESSFTEDVDLNAKFTLLGVSEIIPHLTKVGYTEAELKTIIEMLNNDSAKFEEVYMAVAEKRIRQKEDDYTRIKNWRNNLKTLAGFVKGQKHRVVQGEKQEVKRITKADVILFKQQHQEVIRSATDEEFKEAVSRFRLQSDAKAKTIRAVGLGFVVDENLQDNIRDMIQQIKSTGLLSSIVISRINGQLKEMRAPYHVQNIGRGGTLAYAPVDIKRTLKVDAIESKSQELKDFFAVVDGAPITFGQAMFLVYEWLQDNKVHPSLAGETRTYESKKSLWKDFDVIAHEVFDGVVSEEDLERELDRPSDLTEEIINMYNDLKAFRSDLIERMQEAKDKEAEGEVEYTEHELEDMALEKDRADFFSSKAFLIISGNFKGNLENLTEAERELYRSTATAYMDEVLTPVEAEVLAIQDEVNSESYEKTLKQYTKWVLSRVKEKDVSLQEIVALHRIVTKGNASLTKKQTSNIMNAIHSRLIDGSFVYSTILAGKDILRVMPGSTVEKIEFFNIETKNTTFATIHEALTMIDKVLENGTEYQKNNTDTTFTEEDSGILKQAYSDVFVNLAETISEVKDMEPEVLKASIIEELNRCK